jgi:putative thioredoxin
MVDLAARDDVGAPVVKATTTATFSADVLSASARQPVLVLFLSPRSEACRTMRASLERVIKAAAGKVSLVTMDIDAEPQIASRLGVRGVPAVFAFQRGQPIDGFMGPLPEPEIKGFLERLVGPLDDGLDEALGEAEAALAAGDMQTATAIYSAILDQDPSHPAAAGGLARALVTAGDLAGARQLLDSLPPSAAKDQAVAAARAALDLAEQASAIGDLSDLQQKVAADPDDHQALFDLALGLAGKGQKEEAADALIASIRRDRTWNDGAARKQLLQFFEAWGLMDPVTLAARRKLSTLLFA